MTEREIPDGLGFLFGGMTDHATPESAPPALSEPENPIAAAPAPTGAPVYLSRRELRAAGGYTPDAAAPAAPSPAAPTAPAPAAPGYGGVAALFPLLGEVTTSPVPTQLPAPSSFDAILAPPPAELGATQAMPVAEVAAELATPVAPYVVPQSAPVQVIPVPLAPPVADDPFAASRRALRDAAPAQPTGRQKKPSRAKRAPASHPSSGKASSAKASSSKASNGKAAGRSKSRAADDHKPVRQRLFGVGVMVLVGGLFAVLALPAYADNDASSLTAAAAVQTQKLTVEKAAASTLSTSTRDGYTATSAADLKKLYSDAIRQRNLQAYLQSGAKAQGDDYPWFAELSRNQGGGLSPLNYYFRECVDFVAWRLNRDQGSTHAPFKWTWSTLTPSGGNASQWKSAWLNHGWGTGTTPQVGSVAWFPYNHVAYVSGILNNGQVLVEEYNWEGEHLYGTRVINPGDAYYLYAPPA